MSSRDTELKADAVKVMTDRVAAAKTVVPKLDLPGVAGYLGNAIGEDGGLIVRLANEVDRLANEVEELRSR